MQFLLCPSGDTSDYRLSTTFESRRKQATAIVMMGVLGAEFGQEMEPSKRKEQGDKKQQQTVKGFGITDYSHARHTSECYRFRFILLHEESRSGHKLKFSLTPVQHKTQEKHKHRSSFQFLGRRFDEQSDLSPPLSSLSLLLSSLWTAPDPYPPTPPNPWAKVRPFCQSNANLLLIT